MRLGLLTFLLLLRGFHDSGVLADSISSLSVKNDAIVIAVPTTVVGGNDGLVSRWERAIERVWNRGNDGRPFVVCGRPVRFEPRFAHIGSPPAAPNSHLVMVETVRGRGPFVSSVSYELGTSPSYSPRAGSWASEMNDATVAHEFGHPLGLLDEYVVHEPSRNRRRQQDEVPRPNLAQYPDASFSLMAVERGVVLARHVREIIRMHGGEHLLACR